MGLAARESIPAMKDSYPNLEGKETGRRPSVDKFVTVAPRKEGQHAVAVKMTWS